MQNNSINKEQKLDKEVLRRFFEKAFKAFDKAMEEGRVEWFKEKLSKGRNYIDIRDFKLGWRNVISYDILKPQYSCHLDKLRYNISSGWEYRKVDNKNLYGGGA